MQTARRLESLDAALQRLFVEIEISPVLNQARMDFEIIKDLRKMIRRNEMPRCSPNSSVRKGTRAVVHMSAIEVLWSNLSKVWLRVPDISPNSKESKLPYRSVCIYNVSFVLDALMSSTLRSSH